MSVKYISFSNIRKMAFSTKYQPITDRSNELSPVSINIFSGPNGSGKSTIIDILRVILEPVKLMCIGRENMNADTVGLFKLIFDNRSGLIAKFVSQGIGEMHVELMAMSYDNKLNKISHRGYLDTNKPQNFPSEYSRCINLVNQNVAYRSNHDLGNLPLEKVVGFFNKDAQHLLGTAASGLKIGANKYERPGDVRFNKFSLENCFQISDYADDKLFLWLHDDELQTNEVHINELPAGWKAFGGLLTWLSVQEDRTICLIEEPEVHIHPLLQRILIKRIQEIAHEKHLQLFISTHSTVFLEYGAWDSTRTNLYEADGYGIRNLTRSAAFITSMGIRPGDVFQANGLIWIEGVSDRIYIKHWIKLYCNKNGIDIPVENVHYAFMPYGGAMLKHYSAQKNDTIQALMINKNCIFIADRDNDYDMSNPKSPRLLRSATAKEAIRKTIPTWITEGYTIEDFLPEKIFSLNFDVTSNKTTLKNGKSKVNCAMCFESEIDDFDLSYNPNSNLPKLIKFIVNSIEGWNR
ncbi:AAA family ATPase [Erwinia amylovora]|uniref:AAA family ATPase n=1 Tax=Erwinia amylovora TaxID=552 RepID=UPI0035C721BF